MNSKLHVQAFSLGKLETNCYIVSDKLSKEAIVIDPADAGEFIVEKVQQSKLLVKKIIATHGHFDHILAATYLQLTLDAPFLLHEKDVFLLDRMQESAIFFLGKDPGPKPIISGNLKDNLKIKIGNISLKVVHTPGHTPGSVSLLVDRVAFVGDLLFAEGGVGRTDFGYSDTNELQKSVAKILSLPANTTLYSGHGGETTVGREVEIRRLEKRGIVV